MKRIACILFTVASLAGDALAQRPPNPDACCRWVYVTRCNSQGTQCKTTREWVCYERC